MEQLANVTTAVAAAALNPTEFMMNQWEIFMNQSIPENWTVLSTADIDSTTPYPDYSQLEIVRAIFLCLFLVEFVVSVIGNFLVCLTVCWNKSMHSVVNCYIVNLGICDFLIGAFVLPTKLFVLTAEAKFNMLNDHSCTALRFLETVVVFTSVFTLVAICIERYNAIVNPMESRVHMTGNRIRKVLLMVWCIPIIAAAPNLYPAEVREHKLFSEFGEFSRLTCFDTFSDEFRQWYFFFLFVFMYIVPLVIIAATCCCITKVLLKKIIIQPSRDPRAVTMERGRRKVAKMILVIVCTFVICWSPYFFVSIITQIQTENFLHHGQFFFTMLCINLFCFTNSCVNPIVYFAMSSRFRRGINCLFSSMCPRRQQYPSDADTSLMSLRNVINHRRRGAIRTRAMVHNNLSHSQGPAMGPFHPWV